MVTGDAATGGPEPGDLQRQSDSYRADLRIGAPRPAVYAALTTLEGLAGWWSPVAGGAVTGGELRLSHQRPDTLTISVDEASYPERVRWRVLGYELNPEWAGTEIAFDLEDDGPAGTRLRFAHVGLVPALECFEACRAGWHHFLGSLRSYVEQGEGSPLAL